jgi:tetratricopeptide (TPR) repeat protein
MPRLILVIAVGAVLVRFLFRLGPVAVLHDQIFRRGDWPRAERWLRRLGFAIRPWYRLTMEVTIAEFSGRTAAALDGAERLIAETDHPLALNQCVNVFINGGRYRRALELAPLCPAPSSRYEKDMVMLLQVNLAEAEYNLGRWREAEARLGALALDGRHLRISGPGAWQQKAWALAHGGRATEARAAVTRVEPRRLPRIYLAEYQYTLAVVALAERDTTAAQRAVERGLALARRAASLRNGLFLRARILVSRGDQGAALADFERAAAMPYRGQGGDGLLAWGDLLRSLGREEEARHAYALALERDPESVSAREAEGRLGASARVAAG